MSPEVDVSPNGDVSPDGDVSPEGDGSPQGTGPLQGTCTTKPGSRSASEHFERDFIVGQGVVAGQGKISDGFLSHFVSAIGTVPILPGSRYDIIEAVVVVRTKDISVTCFVHGAAFLIHHYSLLNTSVLKL
jgi:hypothetical protein